MIGDQQSACVGHGLQEFEAKATVGTGTFIMFDTGDKLLRTGSGLLTTVLYTMGNKTVYAIEGAVEAGSRTLNKLNTTFKLFDSIDDIPKILRDVGDSEGVIIVPAFNGLFSPYWDSSARGSILGITDYTQSGHILFAAREVIEVIEKDLGIVVECLRMDGGLSNSDEFLQIQANICGLKVEVPEDKEVTCRGAAVMAAIGAGLYGSIEEALNKQKLSLFESKIESNLRENKLAHWEKAIKRSVQW